MTEIALVRGDTLKLALTFQAMCRRAKCTLLQTPKLQLLLIRSGADRYV